MDPAGGGGGGGGGGGYIPRPQYFKSCFQYEKPNKDAVLAKESALKRVRMEIKERNV